MKILNYGSLNMDYVYRVDHIALPGETIRAADFHMYAGGKGLNQSIALSRAEVRVCHAGNIGQDGDMLLDLLNANGIDTTHIRRVAGPTGHAMIQVNTSGQNSIVVFGGANLSNTEESVGRVMAAFDPGDILLVQNEINRMDAIIEKARQRNLHIVLNPSPVDEALLAYDLSSIDTFILNEVEGARITGHTQPKEILAQMKARFPRSAVVLTLGKAGAVYQKGEDTLSQGIYDVAVVDTTGAGDTFTGYFLAMIAKDHSVKQALSTAAKAAALAVSKPGAADSIPHLRDVQSAELVLLDDGPKMQ